MLHILGYYPRRELIEPPQYDLLMTGGTDYHGSDLEHPENEPWQLNQFKLPLSLLEFLKQAVDQFA